MNSLINLGGARKAAHRRIFVPATLLVICTFSFPTTVIADELVKNGGFELPKVEHDKGWSTYYGQNGAGECEANGEAECNDGVLIPDWEVFWTDFILGPQILVPGRVELQNNTIESLPNAKSGEQKAELDSHHRKKNEDGSPTDNNATIHQSLATCPRSPYTLTYAWHSRTTMPHDNDMRVIVRDSIVRVHTLNTDWDVEEYNFVSDDLYKTALAFASIGDNTTFGGFLDDVSVTGNLGGSAEACNNHEDPMPICANGKPQSLTLLYDGNAFSLHGQDSNEVIITEPTGEFPNPALIKVYSNKKKNTELVNSFTVNWGETFDVSGPQHRIPSRLKFEIIDPDTDEVIQTVQFHTSCSQPLEVLDEFGGITVWAADVIVEKIKITPVKPRYF